MALSELTQIGGSVARKLNEEITTKTNKAETNAKTHSDTKLNQHSSHNDPHPQYATDTALNTEINRAKAAETDLGNSAQAAMNKAVAAENLAKTKSDADHNHDTVYLKKNAKATLTDNDGHGNANLTFNHTSGKPQQSGSSYRIETATDANAALLNIEMKSNVVANTATSLTTIVTMSESAIDSKVNLLEKGLRVYSPNNIPSLETLGAATGNHNHDSVYYKKSDTVGKVSVSDQTTGNVNYPIIWHNNSNQLFDTATKLYFNPSTGILTSTGGFSGNAASATKLQTARALKIGNTSKNFDGSAGVTWTLAEIGAAASNHNHDSAYLKLDGGTVTGTTGITLKSSAEGDSHSGAWLKPIAGGGQHGTNLEIGTGGKLAVFGGEGSALNMLSDLGGEDSGFGADGTVKIYTNANTWANRKTFTFGSDGNLTTASQGKLYGENFKPSLSALGAAASNHNHDSVYYKKSDTVGKVSVSDHTTGNINYPIIWHNNSNQLFDTATKLYFNPSTGILTSTGGFSGNAASATKLQTARALKIGNTSKNFDGSAGATWTLAEIGAAASNHSHNNYLPLAGGTITGSLTVNGSILSKGNVTAYSDSRIKENIKPLSNSLNKVLNLCGVTYDRTDIEEKEGRHMGLIAQDVEKILPELVHTSVNTELGIDDFRSIDYSKIVVLLIEAVKELNQEIQELKKERK